MSQMENVTKPNEPSDLRLMNSRDDLIDVLENLLPMTRSLLNMYRKDSVRFEEWERTYNRAVEIFEEYKDD